MFTHADVENINLDKLDTNPAMLTLVEFEPSEFDNKGEDYVQIFTGEKSFFHSAISFWTTIIKQELPPGRWLDDYLSKGGLRQISLDEYKIEIQRLWPSGKCPLPEDLLFSDQPIEVALIWLNCCDDVILATFQTRYLAVRWYSTA